MANGDAVAADLTNRLRWLMAATLFLYLALVGVVVYAAVTASHQRAATAEVAFRTNNALCEVRADLTRRVEASTDFLVSHPDGVAGIPAKDIQKGIDDQQRTIDALAVLECPPDRG